MDPIRCDVTNRCPFLSLSPSPSFECFVMGLWRPGRSDSSATGPNNKNLMKARAVLLYTFRPIQMGKMKLEKKKENPQLRSLSLNDGGLRCWPVSLSRPIQPQLERNGAEGKTENWKMKKKRRVSYYMSTPCEMSIYCCVLLAVSYSKRYRPDCICGGGGPLMT